jgi:hypothetical protein
MQSIAQTYLSFCKKHGFNERDYDNSLRLCLLLSLRAVNRRKIFETLGNDAFVDWDHFETQGRETCAFGTAALTWVFVLQCFDPNLFAQKVDESECIPGVLQRFNKQLHGSSLRCEFSRVAMLFLLSNVNKITMTQALTAFFRDAEDDAMRTTHIKTFVMQQADERADSQEYEEALSYILRRCVLLPSFESQVAQHVQSQLALQTMFSQRQTQVLSGRPRLRERLREAAQLVAEQVVDPDHITQVSRDSFNGWCTNVRFPNNVNVWLRQKLYFIQCQREQEAQALQDYMYDTVDKQLVEQIAKLKIAHVETVVVQSVIAKTSFFRQPFTELVRFREVVTSGLANHVGQHLTYSTLMQLYLTVYQRESIWQQCWKGVLPHINHTVISNIKNFVAQYPMNKAAVVQLLSDS